MRAKKRSKQGELFRIRLAQIVDLNHELCVVAREIDWQYFEDYFGSYYSEKMGRPASEIRLMVGVHYLKHAFNQSMSRHISILVYTFLSVLKK